MPEWRDLIEYWFSDEARPRWFVAEPAFDEALRGRFAGICEKAVAGELQHWAEDAEGCLALVIALDQLPRNLYRGTPRAYAGDEAARKFARLAISRGDDKGMTDERRWFFYLPFEHSEDLLDQEFCVRLMRDLTDPREGMKYAERHLEIIARFGRFPHRNKIFGRQTTEAEAAFLTEPNSSF